MSDNETLVVISKLKNYIKSTAGMNTAGNVAPALSNIIRRLCDDAIEKARSDGRKTVMDRDF
jgi:histone H3/H4